MFTQLVETSRPFVREASMFHVYALIAFGGNLEVLHDQGLLLLDGWAKFKAPARVGRGGGEVYGEGGGEVRASTVGAVCVESCCTTIFCCCWMGRQSSRHQQG